MALIKCHECGNDISDKASACPKCGNPIASKDGNYVTTQKTSKKFKWQMIGAFALVAFGLIVIGNSPGFGILLILGGVVWLVSANTLSWWENG